MASSTVNVLRAPDEVRIFISTMHISSRNLMFDHLLESSHRDDSNKWSNIGFGEEITQALLIEVNFMHLIRSTGSAFKGLTGLVYCAHESSWLSIWNNMDS